MDEDRIYRASGNWTMQVHKFLRFLREQGFDQAPEPLGFDTQGREIVSFVRGNTYDYPLSQYAKSKAALISAALLLRKFHDASQKFLTENKSSDQGWMFTSRSPQEVICHNDFAPYNICFDEEQAIGIIDFDTACPGPRAWDIAYAIYRFAPFMDPKNIDGFGTLAEQIARASLFCQTYGLPETDRITLAELMIERLQVLISFMIHSAQQGNEKYIQCMQNNHHLLYSSDINYIKIHKDLIDEGLTKNIGYK